MFVSEPLQHQPKIQLNTFNMFQGDVFSLRLGDTMTISILECINSNRRWLGIKSVISFVSLVSVNWTYGLLYSSSAIYLAFCYENLNLAKKLWCISCHLKLSSCITIRYLGRITNFALKGNNAQPFCKNFWSSKMATYCTTALSYTVTFWVTSPKQTKIGILYRFWPILYRKYFSWGGFPVHVSHFSQIAKLI